MKDKCVKKFSDFSREDLAQINLLLDVLVAPNKSVENIEFLKEIQSCSWRLPESMVSFVKTCQQERIGVAVIDTAAIIPAISIPTPIHWTQAEDLPATRRHEVLFALISGLFGNIFGWQTQQNGRMMHDLMPLKKHENEQVGFSSKQELSWHTEDAFHEYRADYLSLFCMRNPERVPTTLCSSHFLELSEPVRRVLRQPHFAILPDNSHKPEANSISGSKFNRIHAMMENPSPTSILFGDNERPSIRIDPDYCVVLSKSPEVEESYAEIVDEINNKLFELPLSEGEICFIDNSQVVHGRRSFSARYDGLDRWLKRVNIRRNLNLPEDVFSSSKNLMI